MRHLTLRAASLCSLLTVTLPACAQTADASTGTLFVASTPCSAITRPVPGIPKDAGCELIKWRLRLLKDTYLLDCDYGLAKQGTRGFINGGNHLHREGKWIAVKGATTIYRLDPDKPAVTISFRRLNDHLLHLLDSHDQLMIGTAAWSYTLNKAQP